MKPLISYLLSISFLISTHLVKAETTAVGLFSQGQLGGWEEKTFKGTTHYKLQPEGSAQVLAATISGGASGKFKKIKIDLNRTPYLNWRWKVDQTWLGLNEKTKSGDDYPARLYVVVERGLFGISSKTVNYVWASQQSVGSLWPNAFTTQAALIAVESGNKNIQQWRSYKRNVKADLRQAFGEDFTHIDAVALMSDGDNSQQTGRAYFGDIWFTAD
ncbi:DUF3047 domain-containing protein [Iodobacter ciconiae]|uniref:DUF3047 domain-containing protein n=1 Tax=Iodobacter ciconiae TaxID=2496266 RepID=A0A3S8ZRT1_9NEIS|nr:DUF3047 domain-containing protein [Iodobacter ciconiae]AZN36178.1 DUF3047 domain-containing protein [Iodobacter ciconiae]